MTTLSTRAELTAFIDAGIAHGIEGFTLIGCCLAGELLADARKGGFLMDFYGAEGETIEIDGSGIVTDEFFACGSFGE